MKLLSITLTMVCILLSGCTVLNYGHTQEEWGQLTKQEQQKVLISYQKIIQEKAEMVIGDPAEKATEDFIQRAVGEQGSADPL